MKLTIITILCMLIIPSTTANSHASANTLLDYRWEHRIVITKVESNHSLNLLQTDLSSQWDEITERKLIIMIVTNIKSVNDADEVLYFQKHTLTPLNISVKEINNRIKTSGSVLIGLDGGSKAFYNNFDIKQVFVDIDGMLMRRAEMSR